MTPQKAQQRNRLQLFRLASQLLFLSAAAFSLIQMNFILTGVLLAIALLGGSFYCGWLCPFGLFQEILSWLGKKISPSGKVLKIPLKLEKKLIIFRYALLLVGLISLLGIYLPNVLTEISSPLQTFSSVLTRNISYIKTSTWIIFGVVLILSIFIERPFCRYLCPQGALYGLLSLGRILTIKRNKNTCVSCGLCDRSCPMQIQISEKNQIRNTQCINCFRCISSCKRIKALSFGFIQKT